MAMVVHTGPAVEGAPEFLVETARVNGGIPSL